MPIHSHTILQTSRWRPSLATIIFILVLLTGLGIQSIGAWQDSQTTDEAVHVAAGYSYWRTGDFRLNPEHPPLVKLLATAPLLAMPNISWSTVNYWWQAADRSGLESAYAEWALGADFLYPPGQPVEFARIVLFIARLPIILIWASLAWLLYIWGRQRWGPGAGLLASTMYVFDPNFLGHGHLVTTDVAMAAGFAATVWAADRFLNRPTWLGWGWLCGLFALTQVTKFSAILLWLIIPLLAVIRLLNRPTLMTWRWWWRLVIGLIVVTSVLMWSMYRWEIRSVAEDPKIVSAPYTALAPLTRIPVPAYSYLRGLLHLAEHNAHGHPSYLFGQISQFGWWYYFPVAAILKMPPVMMLLLIIAGAWHGRRFIRTIRQRKKNSDLWSVWLLVLPSTIYLLWSFTSHINIGVRHLFPIYPFLYLAIGSLTTIRWSFRRWRWSHGLMFAAVMAGVTTIIAWPNTLGYFSGIVGGTNKGGQYLLDSNIDWNQDVWRLRDFLQRHNITSFQTLTFSWLPVGKFFPQAQLIPTDQDIAAGRKPSGVVVIRVTFLYWPEATYTWLRAYQPRWRIGSSLLVYDFRKSP